jgi:dihydroorotase-like cyclic amidohydrolase
MNRSLLTNGLIFDGLRLGLLAGHDVVFENRVIAEISPAPSGPFDPIADLKGVKLMPGLIDVRFHA